MSLISLRKVSWRYLWIHRWQTLLMVFGIALGVAVMVSIDLANAGSRRAFELSTQAITGKATHQIIASGEAFDESIYVDLQKTGLLEAVSPIISINVSSPNLGNQPYQLLGFDFLEDRPFRDYWDEQAQIDWPNLVSFFTQPGAVLLSKDMAERYQLTIGQEISILVNGIDTKVFLAGIVYPRDNLSARTLSGLILADIATAQEITGFIGKISRIDLIIPEGNQNIEKDIQAILPEEVRIVPAQAQADAIQQMTAAFQLNLSALSMLALVVGLFLIYNTMTFSVIQRRALFGTLRCLGVTRKEIFIIVLGEAIIVGIIGSAIGVGLGIGMGRNTISLVSQTINDLYFTTTVRDIGLPLSSLIKGGLIGLVATIVTAVIPAIEAAGVPPRVAITRSGIEEKAQRFTGWITLGGVICFILGGIAFWVPNEYLIFGFGGTFFVVIGFAMLSINGLQWMMTVIRPITQKLFGWIGKIAPRSLLSSLSRTGIAVSALMIAVAVSIGVTLMIDSFRYTVTIWLEQTLQSDIYISAPSFTSTQSTTLIDQDVVSQLRNWPNIQRVDLLRTIKADSPLGGLNLSATNNPDIGKERYFKSVRVQQALIYEQLNQGGILISEPLTNRFHLEVGDLFGIYTPGGLTQFQVIGIFYDYASSEGSAMISLDRYQKSWGDPGVTAIGIRLRDGVNADEFATKLQDQIRTNQSLLIRANQALREEVMDVFDRTFAITFALRILATVVAFIGILSTLLMLLMEKQRELGIFMALGLTGRQLWKMIMLETGLMGLAAGVFAIPTGIVLSLILIFIINMRSFGWTLQMNIQPLGVLFAVMTALIAALMAGVIPAYRISRMTAIEAIRYE